MGQSMKFVTAIVKPVKLDDILDALTRVGIHGPIVTEARDYGQKGHTEFYRGAEYTAKFLSMLRIEVAVPSDQVENVTEAIVGAAKTGQIGDGKIFVFDLEHAMSIRGGNTDEVTPRLAA